MLLVAALPALCGFLCLVLRAINARKTALWVRTHYPAHWNGLHALARHHAWAAVEILIKKGLLSGDKIAEFRRRDEQLEKCSWLGVLSSALLILMFALFSSAFANSTNWQVF